MTPAIKQYAFENILAKTWRLFLLECVMQINSGISHKLNAQKLRKNMINFYTLVIGINSLEKYILFPKKSSIMENIDYFRNGLLYLDKNLSGKDLTFITDIVLKYNEVSKKNMDRSLERIEYPEKIEVISETKGKNIKLKVLDFFPYEYYITLCGYEKLKKSYQGKENFDIWVCCLLRRYTFYGELKESICLSIDVAYKFIKSRGYEDYTLEAFAGSLNSNLDNYCSLFYDIEYMFGSKGSFFNQDFKSCPYQIIVSNPPFIAEVIEKASQTLLEFLSTCPNSLAIMIIPDWRGKSEYEKDRDIEIKFGSKKIERMDINYDGYHELRDSKYFRNIIFFEDYEYYNFFKGEKRGINLPTIIMVLSKDADDSRIRELIGYLEGSML